MGTDSPSFRVREWVTAGNRPKFSIVGCCTPTRFTGQVFRSIFRVIPLSPTDLIHNVIGFATLERGQLDLLFGTIYNEKQWRGRRWAEIMSRDYCRYFCWCCVIAIIRDGKPSSRTGLIIFPSQQPTALGKKSGISLRKFSFLFLLLRACNITLKNTLWSVHVTKKRHSFLSLVLSIFFFSFVSTMLVYFESN